MFALSKHRAPYLSLTLNHIFSLLENKRDKNSACAELPLRTAELTAQHEARVTALSSKQITVGKHAGQSRLQQL